MVADDLDRWQEAGRVEWVRLKVRITAIEASLNEVEVRLNNQVLGDDLLLLNDYTYRLTSKGPVNPYGFVYEFVLPPDCFPREGDNRVTVILRQRDRKISLPFEVYDVDLEVRYQQHGNYQRNPLGRAG